ncbi:Arylesterase [uncultured archaeon]|nr:Arylesterase [uncultured archaeon]
MNKRGQLYIPSNSQNIESTPKSNPWKKIIWIIPVIIIIILGVVFIYKNFYISQETNTEESVKICMNLCMKENNDNLPFCTAKCNLNINATKSQLCGDGICDNLERAHSLLCPRDCINKSYANVSCINGFEYNLSTNTCQAKNVTYICQNGTLNNSTNVCEVNAPITQVCPQGNYNSLTGNCEISPSIAYVCSEGNLTEINGTKYCVEYVQQNISQKDYSVYRTAQAIYNLNYGSGSNYQRLDLYFPANLASNQIVPLIIDIHGGGFEGGDKTENDSVYYAIKFSGQGYAVATLNYRLASEAKYPAANYDVKSAVRWLRANADKYGLDNNHVGVIGRSAGGYLAALLGVTGDNRTFDVGDNLNYSSSVQAVIDQYGITDFSTFSADLLSQFPNRVLGKGNDPYLNCVVNGGCGNRAVEASPINYVSGNDSPFFIIHGNIDDHVPINQSKKLYSKLQNSGVVSYFTQVSGAGHGGTQFNDPYIDQYVEFFNKYLKS